MKILHINTWDAGGAGGAAKRLFFAQKKHGLEVDFLALKPKHKPNKSLHYYSQYLAKKYGKLFAKFLLLANKIYNQLPVRFDLSVFFNRPESLFRIHKHPLVQNADIIHLHAVVKFLDYPTFFKNVNKPIVWTLHDMNPFSGGKHYETGIKKGLSRKEEKFIQIKQQALKNKNLQIVGLAEWLKNLSQHSKVLSQFPHTLIPNCINTEVFNGDIKAAVSNKNTGKQILFVAENVHDKRKGFKYLLDALPNIEKNIQLNILGNVEKNLLPNHKNITLLGYVSTPQYLAQIYTEADVYVIASIEDNLPNTIIESHMCGTPVVGFNRCGIANMIQDGENGILVDELSGEALASGICKAFNLLQNNKNIRKSIAANARARYSEEKVVAAYNKVYKELFAQQP